MKEKMRMKGALAVLIAVMTAASMLPTWAFAESTESTGAKAAQSAHEAKVAQAAQGEKTLKEAPPHDHMLVEFPEKEATCEKSGMKHHYYCSVEGCDALFYDAEGKEEVADPLDLIIPIKEHEWDEGHPKEDNLMITVYTCKNCGATKEVDDPDNFIPGILPPTVKPNKTFKLLDPSGNTLPYKLQFKTKVTKQVFEFMEAGKVDHVTLKAAKSKMTVNWKVNNKMKFIDEVIILRKTGKESVYKEVGRAAMKKNNKGELVWSPKTSYADKTAKTKNTPYSYIAVACMNENDISYISSYSDWAAGQTTASKLKSVNKAKISKSKLSLQYKGSATLTTTYAKPKTTYNAKSFRWYTDNKKVAKVSDKGKVKATGVGSTTIRCRLSTGDDVTCKVSVVGAFKPSTPTLKVDVATENSITLVWNKTKNATAYDLYRSDDGLHWKDPVKVKGTSKKVTGLKKNHRYTFYVVARNDNHGYTEVSKNSNIVNQKAVVKRRPTEVTGFPKKKTLTAGTTLTVTLTITTPDKRKASLQMMSGKRWSTKKTVTLPAGSGKTTVKIIFPNNWWGGTTKWRLVIPRNNTSEEYTSHTLTIKSKRVYQNPSSMIQISNKISKHGFNHYVAPVLINDMSTRTECVEALIKTANKYKGTAVVSGKTGAPGNGIDAGGLVIESCYGGGIDLWPVSPSTRNVNAAPAIMSAKLQVINNYGTPADGDFPNVYRGDLVFFHTGKNNVGHVAIYTGYGQIIHASQVTGKVETAKLTSIVDKKGKYKYTIAGVRRIYAF